MFPSSIFSFETLRVDSRIMRDGLRTLLCTLVVVLGAELVSRYFTSSAAGVWEYWSEDAFFFFF